MFPPNNNAIPPTFKQFVGSFNIPLYFVVLTRKQPAASTVHVRGVKVITDQVINSSLSLPAILTHHQG